MSPNIQTLLYILYKRIKRIIVIRAHTIRPYDWFPETFDFLVSLLP